MTLSHVLSRLRPPTSPKRGWRRDERGSTAIEFGMVAVPFFFMLTGVMGAGMQFFTQNSLENGVETASRQLMTGQAQLASKTVKQFRDNVCTAAGGFIKCDSAHLSVVVKSWKTWAEVQPQSCVSGGSLAPPTGMDTELVESYAGAPGEIVLITLCYKWDLAKGIITFSPVKLADGSAVMQATTAFRTEPFK